MKLNKLIMIGMMLLISEGVLAGGAQDKFWEAVMQCDLAGVKKWVDKGADPMKKNSTKQNSLSLAFLCPEVTAYLIELGVDPNSDGGFALLGAATGNSFEVMKLLLDAGAKPDATNETYANMVPIHAVISQTNCVPCLKVLIEAGAKIEMEDKNGWNYAHHLAISSMTAEQRKANYTISATSMAGFGYKVPEWYGNLGPDRNGTSGEMLDVLIEAGVDINAKSTKKSAGFTPLMWAIGPYGGEGGKEWIAKALIERGADLSIMSNETPPQNALYYAKLSKNPAMAEIVKLIQQKGG